MSTTVLSVGVGEGKGLATGVGVGLVPGGGVGGGVGVGIGVGEGVGDGEGVAAGVIFTKTESVVKSPNHALHSSIILHRNSTLPKVLLAVTVKLKAVSLPGATVA